MLQVVHKKVCIYQIGMFNESKIILYISFSFKCKHHLNIDRRLLKDNSMTIEL